MSGSCIRNQHFEPLYFNAGKLLVSCSDDTTAKVWSLSQDTCIFDLKQHTKEIYTVKWAPLGPNTANPHHSQLLATASFDTSIRCAFTFSQYSEYPIFTTLVCESESVSLTVLAQVLQPDRAGHSFEGKSHLLKDFLPHS